MIGKAACLMAVTLAGLALVLFGLAGTLAWPGAAILLAALGIGNLIMTLGLARKDPTLLRERLVRPRGQAMARFDRIIALSFNLFLLLWLGAMALAARWHGVSQLSPWGSLAAGG